MVWGFGFWIGAGRIDEARMAVTYREEFRVEGSLFRVEGFRI